MNRKQSIIITIFSLFIVSCSNNKGAIAVTSEDYHNAVNKLTDVMVHDIISPPLASRLYVYPSIASYETLNQQNSSYRTLKGQLNGLNTISDDKTNTDEVNLKLASLIAYLDVAKELVFTKEMITSYRDSLYLVWNDKNDLQFTSAKDYGLNISKQIISWMNEDGYNESRTLPDYNVYTDDPSLWEPTPPAYMKGIEPHWKRLRPFVLDSASQFKPIPPPKFSMERGTKFYDELIEVYEITNSIRDKGDDSEEIEIARFWDCNPFVSVNKGHFMFAEKKITPGAHWIGICKIASIQSNSDFSKTVYAYTKTSIAIADAFISCWDEKYRSNLVRPETLINKFIDLKWAPILQTPPFPEYTSGHSVVSGSASEALTAIFGDNFSFDDTTELPYGLPMRSYNSFREAAKEAAISRLYGSIHYRAAVEIGLDQGINVGSLLNNKVQFLN